MLTIYTPIHKIKENLLDTLKSLESQTDKNFEWLILLNGDSKDKKLYLESIGFKKDWIKIHSSEITNNIGALKGECCELIKEGICVELDYDDLLTEDAVFHIKTAFRPPNVQFVYSNSAQFKETEEGLISPTYGQYWGWRWRDYYSKQLGTKLNELIAFPNTPHYHTRIEWAANHVRAFRKSAYEKIGGYDKNIEVGDDHDLVCRFYKEFGGEGFKHLDKCIYLYRVHDDNTCNGNNRNKEIQIQVDKNYVTHSEDMYIKWAKDNKLLCIDLGGRFSCPTAYQSVDLLDADFIMDLEKKWDFGDNTVGVIRAYHLLEHLDDTIHFFNEAYRVLAPGGLLLLEVPSMNCADGGGAIADPTHKKFFNMHSFSYFTNENFAKYIRPQYTGAFQVRRLTEYWWNSPNIPIISGHFIALKDWYNNRWCGEKLTDPKNIKHNVGGTKENKRNHSFTAKDDNGISSKSWFIRAKTYLRL